MRDDGVALHFVDEKLHKAVAQEAGKGAYYVYLSQGGQVMEDRIEPELLPAAYMTGVMGRPRRIDKLLTLSVACSLTEAR